MGVCLTKRHQIYVCVCVCVWGCFCVAAPFCASMTCFCCLRPPHVKPTYRMTHQPWSPPHHHRHRRSSSTPHFAHNFCRIKFDAKSTRAGGVKKRKDGRGKGGGALGRLPHHPPPTPRRMGEYKRAATTRTTTAVPGSLSSDPQPSKVVVWHPLQSRHPSQPTHPKSLTHHHPPTKGTQINPHQAGSPCLPSAGKQAWPATQQTDFDAQSTRVLCLRITNHLHLEKKLWGEVYRMGIKDWIIKYIRFK